MISDNEFEKIVAGASDITEVFQALVDEADKQNAEKLAAKQAASVKNTGVWYDHDETNESGHSLSVYAINLSGKTIAWAMVNNDVVDTSDEGEKVKNATQGVATAHNIFILNATRTGGYESKGLAMRYLHGDGSGTHVDGNSLRTYIMPRFSLIIARLYGV